MSGNCCSYHTAKSAAVLHHLSALLVIYPFPLLDALICAQLMLCTLLCKGGILLNTEERRLWKRKKYAGAKIINRSRHLLLIHWLTYSALKSQDGAFSSMKLPRTGMLGLSVIKQGLLYSGGYSSCLFLLPWARLENFSTLVVSGRGSLPTVFYALQGTIWAKHAWHHFGSFHVLSCGIFQVCYRIFQVC